MAGPEAVGPGEEPAPPRLRSGGEHFFECDGDFRCGHTSSFPTPIYSWQCSLDGSSTTARTTFTGSFQHSSAFTLPFEPFARCYVTISGWSQNAAPCS